MWVAFLVNRCCYVDRGRCSWLFLKQWYALNKKKQKKHQQHNTILSECITMTALKILKLLITIRFLFCHAFTERGAVFRCQQTGNIFGCWQPGTFSVVGNSETGSVVSVMLSVDFKTLIFHG